MTDYRPVVEGTAPAVTRASGRLPDGAVRAIVLDRGGREHDATVGDGVWHARLDQPIGGELPVVRYLDADGEVVPVPLPDGVELAPVEDATEACPVCRAAEWGRVVAAPCGRYGSDGSGRPTAAVCRRCGFEESLGVWSAPTSEPDAQPVVHRERPWVRDLAAVVRSAPFVVYALAGHEATLAGHGIRDDVDTVTLAFTTSVGPVTVWTTTEDQLEPAPWVARDVLEALLHERDEPVPDGSETAMSLWMNGRSRVHAADAAVAASAELDLTVAGEPTTFATVALGDYFAAAAALPGATVVVSGHGRPAGLVLEPYR